MCLTAVETTGVSSRLVLELCIHYFDYRTLEVGLNQIRTVFSEDHFSMVFNMKMTHYYALKNKAVY